MKQRLDVYLTNKFSSSEEIGKFSRVEIQSFIKTGAVKVNDKVIKKPSFEVNEKQDIVIIDDNIVLSYLKDKANNSTLKPKQMDIDIVFENENFIIINKQAGLSVHPGAGNTNNTLVNGLLAMQQQGKITLSNERGDMRLGIVHRLDKDTSGPGFDDVDLIEAIDESKDEYVLNVESRPFNELKMLLPLHWAVILLDWDVTVINGPEDKEILQFGNSRIIKQ